MSQQPIIEFEGKRYRLLDMVLFAFFNSLPEEEQRRFFRDYEVDGDGQGNHIVPPPMRQ